MTATATIPAFATVKARPVNYSWMDSLKDRLARIRWRMHNLKTRVTSSEWWGMFKMFTMIMTAYIVAYCIIMAIFVGLLILIA